MVQPLVSVVVCTFNRAGLVSRCLTSLLAQTAAAECFEVLVVDNNSSDATPEAVARVIAGAPGFRMVREPVQGLSRARNRGAREARGLYLTYLDDDAFVAPDYLEQLIAALGAYRPDLLGGPVYPFYEAKKPAWFKDCYETREYERTTRLSETCRVSGGNFTIRAEVLESLGGFDERLGMCGGNMGFCEDAGVLDAYRAAVPRERQRVCYCLECPVRHSVPAKKMRLGYMLARQYRLGKSLDRMQGWSSRAALVLAALKHPFLLPIFFYRKWRHGWEIDGLQIVLMWVKRLGQVSSGLQGLMRNRSCGPGG